MITTHTLPADVFAELAVGAGDSVVVQQLRAAQLSKNLMLLRVVADASEAAEVSSPRGVAAFRAGYDLLTAAQAADPVAVTALLSLPHIGSWAHDCLACLDSGSPPDFGYLAVVGVAAAVRAGIEFDVSVPVREGGVLLPGLGSLRVPATREGWLCLRSDGNWLRAGGRAHLACASLTPDDGTGPAAPGWQGTPLIRAAANGQVWEVLLETEDRHLDRYTLPMHGWMSADQTGRWRQIVQSAWELLVRYHDWAAGPVAEGVTVIVPLVPRSDLDSATSPAAFGAVATSLPPSPVSMAETLVHEFQHIKLCGLMDMMPLMRPSAERGYAAWRDDPRPMAGILQGTYAFSGIARFWDTQRRLESSPDAAARASALYERWRLAIDRSARTLLDSGCLTPAGVQLVAALWEQGGTSEGGPVPAGARELAREVALDHWLNWQLCHVVPDEAAVDVLAAAYCRGDISASQPPAATRLEDDFRKVDSIARSRVLNLGLLEPGRGRPQTAANMAALGAADALLAAGDTEAAIAAYRVQLAAEPDPAAWIGLALAINQRRAAMPHALTSQLPLLYELHACLARQGVRPDPLDLAAWVG